MFVLFASLNLPRTNPQIVIYIRLWLQKDPENNLYYIGFAACGVVGMILWVLVHMCVHPMQGFGVNF